MVLGGLQWPEVVCGNSTAELHKKSSLEDLIPFVDYH